MTQPQNRDSESQWQQPPFQPSEPGVQPGSPDADRFGLAGPVRGQSLVPSEPSPPSGLESTLNVVNGVLWPALLGMALFGIGSWVGNVIIAIVVSSLLGGISNELKRRRRYRPPSDPEPR